MRLAFGTALVQFPSKFAFAFIRTDAIAVSAAAHAHRTARAVLPLETGTTHALVRTHAIAALASAVAMVLADTTHALLESWFAFARFRGDAFSADAATSLADGQAHLAGGVEGVTGIAGAHFGHGADAVQATDRTGGHALTTRILNVTILAFAHVGSGAVAILATVVAHRDAEERAVIQQLVTRATDLDLAVSSP